MAAWSLVRRFFNSNGKPLAPVPPNIDETMKIRSPCWKQILELDVLRVVDWQATGTMVLPHLTPAANSIVRAFKTLEPVPPMPKTYSLLMIF